MESQVVREGATRLPTAKSFTISAGISNLACESLSDQTTLTDGLGVV